MHHPNATDPAASTAPPHAEGGCAPASKPSAAPPSPPQRHWRQAVAAHPAVQIALLAAIWWLAVRACAWAGVAQLGGVVGMAVLWLLLINGWLRLERVQHGARWLIRHMLLFFIPAVLVVLDHRELLGWTGVKLFVIIVLGTVLVMACTALSIEWCLRLHRHRQALRRLRQRQPAGAQPQV